MATIMKGRLGLSVFRDWSLGGNEAGGHERAVRGVPVALEPFSLTAVGVYTQLYQVIQLHRTKDTHRAVIELRKSG